MATASSSAPCNRPTRRFFQISLRTLMLLLVLCPVAAWYWQRPYEVEVISQPTPPAAQSAVPAGTGNSNDPFGDPFAPTPATSQRSLQAKAPVDPSYRREVRTVRRGWTWGRVIRHGPTTTYDDAASMRQQSFWRAGLLHGPYREWSRRGCSLVEGDFVAGERHGAWNEWNLAGYLVTQEHYEHGLLSGKCIYESGEERDYEAGRLVRKVMYDRRGNDPVVQVFDYDWDQQVRQITTMSLDRSFDWERLTFENGPNRGQFVAWQRPGVKSVEGTWHRGQRDGIWTFWDRFGDVQATLTFDGGTLVNCEGNPIGHYPRSFFQATPAAARIANGLQELTELEFLETPLSEVLQYVRDRHKIPVGFDVRALAERRLGADQPLTCSWGSLSLDLSLYFLLRPEGLTWDYRYGHLWITTVEDARTWKDRSGMSQLEPPQDSRWTAALDAATEVEFIETDFGHVLEYLSAKHGVAIQLHRDFGSGPPITCAMRDISLRSALAAILNRHDLTCELRPDDVLEIRWIE